MTPSEAAVKICQMILEFIAYMLVLMSWIAGIAIASTIGFWEPIAAGILPPYAWVLTAELILRATGLLP
jgi:hypothetical protein